MPAPDPKFETEPFRMQGMSACYPIDRNRPRENNGDTVICKLCIRYGRKQTERYSAITYALVRIYTATLGYGKQFTRENDLA